MSGILTPINELLALAERGLPVAVCTVVATRGSTPQKPGAMMLVHVDGNQFGTLGGGCVEAEVKKRALLALAEHVSATRLHSFVLDDDFGWSDGLICGGQMTIAIEPIHTADNSAAQLSYFHAIKREITAGRGFTQVMALQENKAGANPGERALLDENNLPIFGSELTAAMAERLPARAFRGQPGVIDGWAVLPAQANITLLIVGAGHVGRAVAQLAHDVSFDVWILDDRETYASAEQFPHASRRIVGDITRELQSLRAKVTPSTYCLIVTRGHNHDEEALYHLATTPAGYVGMIGSRRKVRLIFEDLLAKGFTEATLAKVRAPIGLDIGSQTVPEIAVSIVAELIARRNLGPSFDQGARSGQQLRFKE